MASAAQTNQNSLGKNINISSIINGNYQSAEKALSEREKGFSIGGSELAISGFIDDSLYGKFTTVLHEHDGDMEVEVEEAFIQTMSLPAGFSLRGGRFLSNIGYLNNQHTHTDAFADRPAVYRALLGDHYFDDGLRLDYLAPTDVYWAMGVEAFKGNKFRAENDEVKPKSTGVYTAYTKIGDDIGESSSWQLGFSYINNQNGLTALEHHEEEHDHDHEDEKEHAHEAEGEHGHEDAHGHSHAAKFTGKHIYGVDAVYKWAPKGNYKYQHLTLTGEYFKATDLFSAEEHQDEVDDLSHNGWYVSSVYQFSPNWSAGLRYGEVTVQEAHEDHADEMKLKESEFQVSYHTSHFSTIRLQYSHQDGTGELKPVDENSVTLQFIVALGAHGAHQF
nr:hypothetical protein [Parashewanella curva]